MATGLGIDCARENRERNQKEIGRVPERMLPFASSTPQRLPRGAPGTPKRRPRTSRAALTQSRAQPQLKQESTRALALQERYTHGGHEPRRRSVRAGRERSVRDGWAVRTRQSRDVIGASSAGKISALHNEQFLTRGRCEPETFYTLEEQDTRRKEASRSCLVYIYI